MSKIEIDDSLLPEGVEAVRWGQPKSGAFILLNYSLKRLPEDGYLQGIQGMLIVQAKPGYRIEYYPVTNEHKAVKDSPLPRYRMRREVYAFKIASINEMGPLTSLASANGQTVACVDTDWKNARGVQIGGYYVVSDYGPAEFLEAERFESLYTKVE